MKLSFVSALVLAGLAFAGCQNNGNYRDYSQSTQRRAALGVQNDDVLHKHEMNASNPNQGSDTTGDSPEQEAETANTHSKVRVQRGAGEKEEKTGGVVERVEDRPASKPTPTPNDDMNRPLDPIGRPLTAPSPGG